MERQRLHKLAQEDKSPKKKMKKKVSVLPQNADLIATNIGERKKREEKEKKYREAR